MASFWEDIGPGLFEVGAGLYSQRQKAKEAEDRLRRAQGPLYDQSLTLAGRSLGLAEGMDPKAMAAERFAAQQGLLEQSNLADEQQLMAMLQKKGLLGVASHMAVPGTKLTPGVAMNPYLAALYAAREGAKQRSSFEALQEGEKYLDQLVNRGGLLQRQAQTARATGQEALRAVPPKQPVVPQLLGGLAGLLKDPTVMKQIRALLGGGAAPAPVVAIPPAYDYSMDEYYAYPEAYEGYTAEDVFDWA